MSTPIRVGFVVNFVPTDPPGRWLGAYLPEDLYDTDVVAALPPPGSFWARHRWLPPYLDELVQLARLRRRLAGFDVVVPWELRTTLATILLLRLGGRRRPRVVSLNPIVKGWVRPALPVIRRLMRDVDRIVLYSAADAATLRRQLRLPAERFAHLPRFAEPPLAQRLRAGAGGDDYILVLGHSNRDFATLWAALRGTELPVTMYRNPWMRGRELANVTAIPSILPAAEEVALVERAAFVVIPLKPAGFSSGLTVLLRAMARGTAVVVSDTTGIRDYVRHEQTALLVPPGQPGALRAAMLQLWNDPAERDRLGANAAAAVRDRFSTRIFALSLAHVARGLLDAADTAKAGELSDADPVAAHG